MTIRLAFALGTALLASNCFEPPVECGPNGECHRSHDSIEEDAGDAAAVAASTDAGMDGSVVVSPAPEGGSDDAEVGADATASGFCYRDEDGDGVGFGDPIPCGVPTDAQPFVHTTDDCDDLDPDRTPGAVEVCDAIDNDCDLDVDEEALNVCGGPCLAPLAHKPGEACNNGQLGLCARAGTYQCINASAIACNAPTIPAGGELCGDGKDNDCDGQTDEPDATNASRWYKDCDGDGFAATTANFQTSCTKPANDGSCTWTTKEPNPGAKINWDCDDTSTAYAPGKGPGRPPAGKTSWDLDCDGQVEFDNCNTSPPPCAENVSAFLNGTGGSCTQAEIQALGGSCIVWLEANGLYTRVPTRFCPDYPEKVKWNSILGKCLREGTVLESACGCQ